MAAHTAARPMTAKIVHLTDYQGSSAEIRQERDYDTGKIIARMRVARSTIEIMAANGSLSKKQIAAADDFRRIFEQSCFQPRYAKVNFNRVQGGLREFTSQEYYAAGQLHDALKRIRKDARELAWFVIGAQEKLSVYCFRRANMERPISYKRARKLLFKALDDLAQYYGY